jgi:ABC-type dipeptide/oligopeptide/nickel transport system permease subunit
MGTQNNSKADVLHRLRQVAKHLLLIGLGAIALGIFIGFVTGYIIAGLLFGLVAGAAGYSVYFTGSS